MSLPNSDQAVVPDAKLSSYLLSESHPVGRTKARFLRRAGFNEETLALLEQGLLAIARSGDVVNVEPSRHGVKYVVDGMLPTPAGGSVRVRTIWIIEVGEDRPRLVTAYPAPPASLEASE